MPEYVDKGKLLDTLQQCLRGANFLGEHEDANIYASVVSLVDEQPAADVAPVVRCKDCKSAGGFANGPVYCRRTGDAVPEMHFCGYGLRMDAKEDAK